MAAYRTSNARSISRRLTYAQSCLSGQSKPGLRLSADLDLAEPRPNRVHPTCMILILPFWELRQGFSRGMTWRPLYSRRLEATLRQSCCTGSDIRVSLYLPISLTNPAVLGFSDAYGVASESCFGTFLVILRRGGVTRMSAWSHFLTYIPRLLLYLFPYTILLRAPGFLVSPDPPSLDC